MSSSATFTTDTSRPPFPRLTDGNYPQWSMRAKAHLIRRKLWPVVNVSLAEDKTKGKTESEVAALLTTALAARDADKLEEAHAELVLLVDDSQLGYLNDSDPQACWNKLEQVHRGRGFATTLALKRQFLSFSLTPGMSIQTLVGNIASHVFVMENSGIKVTELDHILAITMALPPSYASVVIHFDSLATTELTLDNIIARLVNEETRQATAFPVKEEPTSGRFPKVYDPGEAHAVTYHKKAAGPATTSTTHITCFLCQKSGHYMSDCPLHSQFMKFLGKASPSSDYAGAVLEHSDEDEGGIGHAWNEAY